MAELTEILLGSYYLDEVEIRTGRISSDLAAFSPTAADGKLEVWIDLRHPRVRALEGIRPSDLMAMARVFCMDLLGDALRKASPRFPSDGSSAFEKYLKDHAEEWVLARTEIIECTRREIHEVHRGDTWTPKPGKEPKLVLVQPGWADGFLGYYLKMPGGLSKALMNELHDLPVRAASWIANQVFFVASDGIGSVYSVRIKLDSLVLDSTGVRGGPSSTTIDSRLLPLYDVLYFPIPKAIEPALIPFGAEKIQIMVYYDIL